MASTDRLLGLLEGDTLLEVADALGLEIPDGTPVEATRRALAEHDPATLNAILASLSRDTLKSLCKALSLPSSGRGKLPLVQALTTELSAAVTDEGASRAVIVDVLPRQPRLAWAGMEQREAVTGVPTQVVEIVRPGRARTLGEDRSVAQPALGLFDAREVRDRDGDAVPNRLIWTNDNLVALQTLLEERDPSTGDWRYRGKVDLVYIDPPFMVNSDFRGDNTIAIDLDEEEGIEARKEPSLVEFLAYKDTWRNGLDSFLAMLRRRLELLKALLSPTGSIYVHLDWHAVHYVKVLMDEVFGYEKFVNEIIWKRTSTHADAKGFNAIHDTILSYSNSSSYFWREVTTPHSSEYIKSHYSRIDEKTGRRYRLNDLRSPSPRPNLTYDYKGYKPHKNGWSISRELMEKYDREGLIYYPPGGERLAFKKYLDDDGAPVLSLWTDLPPVNSQAGERLGYPTQKPVALIERIITASCPPGGLVLDCFMGSGTTCEAAERLGRRWVGIDNGKYAVHLARKRLIELHGQTKGSEKPQYDYAECDKCGNIERKEKKLKSTERFSVRPFSVENMGVYQRAEHWQDFQRERNRYRDEMVRVFGGEPVEVDPLLHGRKGDAWIHIGPLDGPVGLPQVWKIAAVAGQTKLKKVTVLSADFNTIAVSERDAIAQSTGVKVEVRVIPKSAIDEVRRRIEIQRTGGATVVESMAVPAFYAPLAIDIDAKVEGKKVVVTLARCEVDIESFIASQRPLLKPLEGAKTAAAKARVKAEHQRWAEREKALNAWLAKATSWQHFVDFWAVDWNYGKRSDDDGRPIFETDWQSFRDRRSKEGGGLVFLAEGRYEHAGRYRVAARVTDVFGNDGIATTTVVVK